MKMAIVGLLGLTLVAGSMAADIEFAGLKGKVPAGWKEENPSNTMRTAQYKLPKAEGSEDAELAVFYFRGGSGSVDQNLARQLAKFKAAGDVKPKVNVEKMKLGEKEATYQDIQGVFLSKFPPFAPNAKITEKADYRQIYVICTTDNGDYYITLLGPAKTVEKHKKDFDAMLKALK
ncbi:MAG: hypothetical protein R3B84_19375 [Zavarzinella sp.]